MRAPLTLLLLIPVVAWTSAHGEAVNRLETSSRGDAVFDCGDLAYDDGSAENALLFNGGGHAGDPDHMFAVRFLLEDFGLEPNSHLLTGFCAGNSFDFTNFGGPWPNEVFVFRDVDGLPDLDTPLRHATMVTGDGTGQVVVAFDRPWLIGGDFWLANRGWPPHAGEDFNMETDQSSEPSGHSYITDRGIQFIFATEQNFLLRATITGAPPSMPVPLLSPWAVLILILLAGGIVLLRSVLRGQT